MTFWPVELVDSAAEFWDKRMTKTRLMSERINKKSKILLSPKLLTHVIAAHGGLFGSTSLAVRGLSVVSPVVRLQGSSTIQSLELP